MAKIEWKGGECPVSVDAIVRVWFKRELERPVAGEAGEWRWIHNNDSTDIIAYEVIEEAKEEPKPEKTLWDEYAIACISSGVWIGMTTEEAIKECKELADAMMKARAK